MQKMQIYIGIYSDIHQPQIGILVYTSPGEHAPDEAEIRDKVVPLFDQYHVNLVLQGHNHNYQRSYPLNYGSGDDKPKVVASGTTYIVAGTGGESHYPLDDQKYYIAK